MPSFTSKLISYIEEKRDELVELASALVRTPTVLGEEMEAQQAIASRLSRAGFDVQLVEPDSERALAHPNGGYPYLSYEGRASVAARLRGTGGGRSLHLTGHVDVVPVDDAGPWIHSPWGGDVVDGRLWGRGAGDMKGGLAAYLVAAEAVATVCGPLRGDLVMSSVIEEECGGNGMLAVLDAGYDAAATLLGEPTGLKLGWAATGVVWARLRARGTAGHSMSAGSAGPFEELALAIAALRRLEHGLNVPARDSVFAAAADWPYSLTVGRLGGGVWTSSAPAELSAWIRFGFGRDLEPADMQARIVAAVASATPDVEVTFEAFRAKAWATDPTGPLADSLGEAHRAVIGSDPDHLVFTATTDARWVDGPCFCYGPIGGGFHGSDEWADVDSIIVTAAVVACTAARWLA